MARLNEGDALADTGRAGEGAARLGRRPLQESENGPAGYKSISTRTGAWSLEESQSSL